MFSRLNKLLSKMRTASIVTALVALAAIIRPSVIRAQIAAEPQKVLLIDGHRHVGHGGFLGDRFRVTDLIEEMDRLGIDKAVILPMGDMPATAQEDSRGLAEIEKANDDYFNRGIVGELIKKLQNDRVDHTETVNAIRIHPQRLVGVYMVNPWIGKPELEVAEYAIQKQGFRGLKLHPQSNAFHADDNVVDPVLKLARQLKVPVMFHTSFGLGTEPARVAKLAARFPDVNIIMYHPGIGEFYKDAIKAAREHPNVYLDTAHAEPEALKAFLEQVPSDRIIFGSDAPWGKWASKFELVRAATKSQPDIQARVMGDNVARVMGLR